MSKLPLYQVIYPTLSEFPTLYLVMLREGNAIVRLAKMRNLNPAIGHSGNRGVYRK